MLFGETMSVRHKGRADDDDDDGESDGDRNTLWPPLKDRHIPTYHEVAVEGNVAECEPSKFYHNGSSTVELRPRGLGDATPPEPQRRLLEAL